MQDIAVGYPDFDRNFIIKGNYESKVRTLFANPRIRQLIQSQPNIFLQVTASDELYFEGKPTRKEHIHTLQPVITDIGRLKSLFELFEETLNQLCQMSSASEDDPHVVL